ncbi:MAG: DUF2177 family protein [Terricaulis sp.]
MTKFLIAYAVTGGAFLALDAIWLTLMSGPFYRPQLGDLMRDKIVLGPSIAFYLIYVGVLTALIVAPATVPMRALWQGMLLGLAAYATYNLTNAATLKNWPGLLTYVDLAWGALATGAAAWLSVLMLSHFRG